MILPVLSTPNWWLLTMISKSANRQIIRVVQTVAYRPMPPRNEDSATTPAAKSFSALS